MTLWRDRRHARIQAQTPFQMRQEAIHQSLEAAPQRISKASIRPHGLWHGRQRTIDHLFKVRQRHSPAKPRSLHFAERYSPQLPVIGNCEVLGDTRPPYLIDELLKVAGFAAMLVAALGFA